MIPRAFGLGGPHDIANENSESADPASQVDGVKLLL